jgi:hypothetical protein
MDQWARNFLEISTGKKKMITAKGLGGKPSCRGGVDRQLI